MSDIYDIVYVKTDNYSAAHNQEIAWEIEKLNTKFLNNKKNYVLVGPGRWGSNDTWLGIPVKWPHISAARVIVEAGLTNYRVDPSQGTHFFQNLTSFGVGYFTINAFMNDGIYNQEFLNAQPAVHAKPRPKSSTCKVFSSRYNRFKSVISYSPRLEGFKLCAFAVTVSS